MRKAFITTVGTSLLTNSGWRFGRPLPGLQECQLWLASAVRAKASAETHSWLRLGVFEEGSEDQVVLVHSDTAEGTFCAEVLAAWLRSERVEVRPERVVNLVNQDERTFRLGLHNLVKKLFACISVARNEGRWPEIVATGGFKAEIAYANTIGMLTGTPVHYIYEGFENMVTLEPLPLDWKRDAFDVVRPLLLELSNVPQPRAKIESWLSANPQLEPLLEDFSDDEVGLSPVGDIVVELLESEPISWPAPSDRAPEEKVRFEGEQHHRPDGWKAAVGRLASLACVSHVRWEGANSKPVSSIWVADADNGLLGGVMVGNGERLGLAIETTARGGAQCELVVKHLRKQLKWK